MKKTNIIFSYMAMACMLVLLGVLASMELKDLDLWLHLGTGKYIMHYGIVPFSDIFSCSIPGQPWVNHEWLFQVLIYSIYDLKGAGGLIFMQIVCVTLTFALLWGIGIKHGQRAVTILVLLLTLLVYKDRFMIRPDIFSLLFMSIFLLTLFSSFQNRLFNFCLFIIQIIWSNVHGFFFFGPFIVGIVLLSEWIKRRASLPWEWNDSKLSQASYRNLKITFLLVVVACLLNPLFHKGAWYPIGVFFEKLSGDSNIFFLYIQELRKPIQWSNIFSVEKYLSYKLLIVGSFVGFIYNYRKISLSNLLLWMFMLLFSLIAIRNLSYFAFMAYVSCVINFKDLSFDKFLLIRVPEKHTQHVMGIFLYILIAAFSLQYMEQVSFNGYYDFDKYERKSEFGGVSLRTYPNKAVDFLVANKIQGNFFNDFNSGAYLVGRAYPNVKVFIDGRTEVYGSDFFKKYHKAYRGDKEQFDQIVGNYKITGVFLGSVFDPIPKDILNSIYRDKEWILVYLDYDAVIFLRDLPFNRRIIDKYAIDFDKYEARKADFSKIGLSNVTPYQHYNRAKSLVSMEQYDLALDEAHEALKIAPAYIKPYKLLGFVYYQKKDYDKAFENLRIAKLNDPESVEVRYFLARTYEHLGDLDNAFKQTYKLLSLKPGNYRGILLLGILHTKKGEYEKAATVLGGVKKTTASHYDDLMEIGDLLFEAGEFTKAQNVYIMTLRTQKNYDVIYQRIGECYKALGNKVEAQRAFKNASESKKNRKSNE